MSPTLVFSATFGPSDQLERYYQYVPVPVDPGTEMLNVVLDYDRSRAVVDLGLFDPAGFRGWSGGERDRFDVGADWATPGYLPGPLPPGEWRVALGLYRVPGEGVEVRVEARTDGRAAPAPAVA
ncbi:MAG: PHP domain-containing protein, partial [Acidimicrobiales bacterium]